jgi:23S rRNA (cytidine1920-2'-O)/16S rRNA (cytidine1409-2'-O)-methyltransferase
MTDRRRIDQLLVARGYFESRARARAAIDAGLVRIEGKTARKASDAALPDAAIEASEPWPWVSRGGVKLAHALDAFGVDPAGRICVDIGASTGGFTHVLLARGAVRIVAIDTGRDQMHASLRADPRVVLCEETDARQFDPARLPGPASLIAVDVSFISLRLIAPAAARLAAADADLVALVKPQFEVGRAHIGKNGVVTDAKARREALDGARQAFAAEGWGIAAAVCSPITGGDGNLEYLLHARRGA